MSEAVDTPITIVDYGMGNIVSLVNMFRRIGAQTTVTNRPEEIVGARKILLPGVGAFDAAMSRIDDLDMRDILRSRALNAGVPFLGICLGMQLLLDSSQEGTSKGLGLIPGVTKRFESGTSLKVPHMGWNTVKVERQTPLTKDLPPQSRFYFVHSYFVEAKNRHDVILTTKYGSCFDAGLNNGKIFGAQFHPEKSHKFGMILLRNFAELPC